MNESNDISEHIMKALSANEAKTHFGDMLLKAQQAPIQINKNGKAIAVVISIDEHKSNEALKLHFLQTRVNQAKIDIANRNAGDGESFFNQLEAGDHDSPA